MRRRLRKKKRINEFEVLAVPLAFRMIELSIDDRNDFIDRFITEALEENKLQFGGGGILEDWSGFIEPENPSHVISDQQKMAVESWLSKQNEIRSYYIGESVNESDTIQLLDSEPDFPTSRLL